MISALIFGDDDLGGVGVVGDSISRSTLESGCISVSGIHLAFVQHQGV
jgi:hypothetical protein